MTDPIPPTDCHPRMATARLYAAVAAAHPGGPSAPVAVGGGAMRDRIAGRPHLTRASLGEMLRGLPWATS